MGNSPKERSVGGGRLKSLQVFQETEFLKENSVDEGEVVAKTTRKTFEQSNFYRSSGRYAK